MGQFSTYPGKAREVSDADWFRLNATVALLPAMFKRGLSPNKLGDFISRLLRDGSPYLIVSSQTNHFDLDSDGYLDALADDPGASYLVEPDNPPPKKEPRFEMPPKALLDKMSPEKKLAMAERERLQKIADQAAGRTG